MYTVRSVEEIDVEQIRAILERVLSAEKRDIVFKIVNKAVLVFVNTILKKLDRIIVSVALAGKLENFHKWLVELAMERGICSSVEEIRRKCGSDAECRRRELWECFRKAIRDRRLIFETVERHVDEWDIDRMFEKLPEEYAELVKNALRLCVGALAELMRCGIRVISPRVLDAIVRYVIEVFVDERSREELKKYYEELQTYCPRFYMKLLRWVCETAKEAEIELRNLQYEQLLRGVGEVEGGYIGSPLA